MKCLFENKNKKKEKKKTLKKKDARQYSIDYEENLHVCSFESVSEAIRSNKTIPRPTYLHLYSLAAQVFLINEQPQ